MEKSQNQENYLLPGKQSVRFLSFLAWTGLILSTGTCIISGYFHQVLPSSIYLLIIPGSGLLVGLSLHLRQQNKESEELRRSLKTFCYLFGGLEIIFSLVTTGLLVGVCVLYYHPDIGDNLGLQVVTQSACRNCQPFMFIYKDITIRASNHPETNFETRGLAVDIYFILSVGLLIFSSLLILGVRRRKWKLVLTYLAFKMFSYLCTVAVLVLAIVDNRDKWRQHLGPGVASIIGVCVMFLYTFLFVYINGFPLMLYQLQVGRDPWWKTLRNIETQKEGKEKENVCESLKN